MTTSEWLCMSVCLPLLLSSKLSSPVLGYIMFVWVTDAHIIKSVALNFSSESRVSSNLRYRLTIAGSFSWLVLMN